MDWFNLVVMIIFGVINLLDLAESCIMAVIIIENILETNIRNFHFHTNNTIFKTILEHELILIYFNFVSVSSLAYYMDWTHFCCCLFIFLLRNRFFFILHFNCNMYVDNIRTRQRPIQTKDSVLKFRGRK